MKHRYLCSWTSLLEIINALSISFVGLKPMQFLHLTTNTYPIKSIVFISVGGGYCQPNDYESARTVFFQPLNSKDKSIWGHPTIKPMNIIQTLIRNSSHEGDIILDCFMGSGTTAVAALREKRHYLGFELDKKYFDLTNERIRMEKQTLRLF